MWVLMMTSANASVVSGIYAGPNLDALGSVSNSVTLEYVVQTLAERLYYLVPGCLSFIC